MSSTLLRLRNHILQALTYYCICHTLVENRTPSLGFGLVVLFQAATIFVAFLDLAGLQHKEIITVQVVSRLALWSMSLSRWPKVSCHPWPLPWR